MGYDRPKAYITCQGPKFYTIKDFWRLIWQEEIETIVMATNFFEDTKRMCAEYWPQKLNTLFECGEMIIKLIKQENYEYHDFRIFEIYYIQHCRKIKHLHLRWDSDTTLYPNVVVPVVKYIRRITENSVVPILIHSG
jgi:protein tyrosine phosphatase